MSLVTRLPEWVKLLQGHVFTELDKNLDSVICKVILEIASIQLDLARVAHGGEESLELVVHLGHQAVQPVKPSAIETRIS